MRHLRCGLIVAAASIVFLAGVSCGRSPASASAIPIVISDKAVPAERIAADQLASYLGKLYPSRRFTVTSTITSKSAHSIYLGTAASAGPLKKYLTGKVPEADESYVVTTARIDGADSGIIFGADPAGLLHGVYGLLEKLGCGFYLSYDAVPEAAGKPFSLDGWELADEPLVRDRIMFNWHNFLSGCTGWDLEQWKHWIGQSQKMGYNTIMVHAYGNNPMFTFELNGRQKPVGFMPSSIRGRDWRNQHCNDVRRLYGGDVFDGPVYASEIGMAPAEKRIEAAYGLMQNVFRYTKDRDMDLVFALDIDTDTSNDQDIIMSLPESARFQTDVAAVKFLNQRARKFWLADPDTPAGYRYYRAQVESMLATYPQIDNICLWFRIQATPVMGLKKSELPTAWQKEYEAEIEKTPEAADYWRSVGLFAVGKISKAFQRAAKEFDRSDIQISIGTWFGYFLDAADRFAPNDVQFIFLELPFPDQILVSKEKGQERLSRIGEHRRLTPVFWAQEDTSYYFGCSLTPVTELNTRLKASKASGFGIIHWITRPQDLYFTASVDQVWKSSADRSLRASCGEMAARSFGAESAEVMTEYLYDWILTGKAVGRETGTRFITDRMAKPESIEPSIRKRLGLLEKASKLSMTEEAAGRIQYLKELEKFILDVYENEHKYFQAIDLLAAGKPAQARAVASQCDAEQVVERFAKFCRIGRMSRGEKGLLVSMNLRWLPFYAQLRQAARGEAVLYNFAATSHEALAHEPGWLTFYLEPDHTMWQCFGKYETGGEEFSIPDGTKLAAPAGMPDVYTEICKTGILSDKPITYTIAPTMGWDGKFLSSANRLSAGKYNLSLLMADSSSTGAGQRVFEVAINAVCASNRYAILPVKSRYLRIKCDGNDETGWSSISEVDLTSLDKQLGKNAVTAAGFMEGYSPDMVIDGDLNTRWAFNGAEQWISFVLDPKIEFDGVVIKWYRGTSRTYRFKIQVSDDGQLWKTVDHKQVVNITAGKVFSVDIFKRAGGQNRVVRLSKPITLKNPGVIELTLTPIRGKSLICGAILEPVVLKQF